VNAWVNSPTHYANLVDKDFSEFGIGLSGGVFDGQPTVYVAQHFAKPSAVTTEPIVKKVVVPAKITKPAGVAVAPAEVVVPVDVSDPAEAVVPVVESAPQVLAEKVEEVKIETLPVVNMSGSTPIDKYIHAKNVLSPVTSIFAVARGIFLGAAIFFSIALALKIFIQIRKQHYHIIAQTSGLIALLIFLYKF
jgi:hypothetical protein